MPSLADKINVCKAGYDAVRFVEKNISNIDHETINNNILGSTLNDTEIVINIKNFFQYFIFKTFRKSL